MRLSAIAWRGLADRPLRSALTATGVALGVAVVMATLIANQASAESIGRSTLESFGAADLRVRAYRDEGFSPATVRAISAIGTVERVAAVSERRLLLSTLPGPDEQVFNLVVLGVDPDEEQAMRSHRLATGAFLSEDSPGEIVLTAGWAEDHSLGVGDELLLTGSRLGTRPLRIVGLVDERPITASAEGVLGYLHRETLDEAFEVPAPISYVDIALADGNLEAAEASLDAVVREPFTVEMAADVRAHLARLQDSFLGMTFLFGALALFVGASLVYNTLAMTLIERTREIGLLRAAGTTSRQIVRLFLAQALAIGVIGASAGLLLGIAVARGFMMLLEESTGIVAYGLPVSPGTALFAFGMGVGVTLLASLAPAYQASRLTALDALRRWSQPGRTLWSRLRWLIVAELAVATAGAALYPVERAAGAVALGLMASGALLAAVTMTAFLLRPLGRVVGRPLEWIFGAEGRLGRANLGRDRARSGLTVGALMVGLATIVALGAVGETARAAGQRWVGSVLPGGHAIRSSVPLDIDTYRPTMEATPGTAAASPVVSVPATTTRGGTRVAMTLAGIDPDVFESQGALIFTAGEREAAFDALRRGGAVVVPEPVARRDGLAVGDRLAIDTPDGAESFQVVGIVAYTMPARTQDGSLLVSLAEAREVFGVNTAPLWVMVREDGVSEASYETAVRATAASLAAEAVTSRQLAGELSQSLDQLIGLFDVLALVAVFVAGLGIVNTLTVGVYERVREIAILRAHGMTQRQVRSMVVVEAAIMGAVGGVIAAVIGLLLAAVVLRLGGGRDFAADLALPVPIVVGVIALGVLTAALGAVYPARLASRLSIVRSVQHE